MSDSYRSAMRVSLIGLTVNMLLVLVKGGVGLLTGSYALIADALHSFSDAGSTVTVLLGLYIGNKPPDPNHPYGHGRAETLAATAIALLLLATGSWMLISVTQALFQLEPFTPGNYAVLAAILSIGFKEALYHYTARAGRRIGSQLLMADAWHHRTDAFSSVAALIGIVGANNGWYVLDPLSAMVVSALILQVGVRILKPTLHTLMDGRPRDLVQQTADLDAIAEHIPHIAHIDRVRIREYGDHKILDLEISVPSNLTIRRGHELASEIRNRIKEHDAYVVEVIVHVNPHPEHEDTDTF